MEVFLTGATGFVGSYILSELLARGHVARCLVRPGSTDKLEAGPDTVDLVYGDITDAHSLEGTLDGCDAVIHLVGIIEENRRTGMTFDAIHYQGTVNVADEARSARIQQFIQMSANGADPQGESRYLTSKWRAEEYLRSVEYFDWTVFRPSIIFGEPGEDVPEFVTRLADTLVRPLPILPIMGDGTYELQPVAVEVVARAFVQALEREVSVGKTYCVAGPEVFTFNEVVDIITRALGYREKRKINVPLALVRPMIELAAPTGLLPISPDQLKMLTTGNTCDPTAFNQDFDVDHRPFAPENLSYVGS
jgi:NADH dehydrogenase